MLNFLKKFGFPLVVIITILMPFAFFSSELDSRRELSVLEKASFVLTTPLRLIFDMSSVKFRNVFKNYIDLKNARQEATVMQEENARLRLQIQMMRELEFENKRLKRLLKFSEAYPEKFLSAEVLSADPSFLYQVVRLSQGEASGVFPGMPVVAAEGVVGVVMRVANNFSDVLLVTDPNLKLDVLVARNRRRGVLEGTPNRLLKFKYIGRGGRVQVGDEIVTGGLSGAFPRGISVGRVQSVGLASDGVSEEIIIEPSVDLSRVTEALIWLKPGREVNVIQEIGGVDWFKHALDFKPGKRG